MRDYPILFSQRDPRWATVLIGDTPGATIGLYGCLLTCWEMKINYYGHTITPPQLNGLFIKNKLFVNGDYVSADNALSIVFPDIVYLQTSHFEGIPADMELLKRLSADETITVTLELDFDHNPTDGIQTHFVELHSFDGNTLMIYDPWDGQAKEFTASYGNNPAETILKFVCFKGVPNNPLVKVDNTFPVDKQEYARIVTEGSSFREIANHFNLNDTARDDPDAGKKLVAVIVGMEKQLEILKTQAIPAPVAPVTDPVPAPAPSEAIPAQPQPEEQPVSTPSEIKPATSTTTPAAPIVTKPVFVPPYQTIQFETRTQKTLLFRFLKAIFG